MRTRLAKVRDTALLLLAAAATAVDLLRNRFSRREYEGLSSMDDANAWAEVMAEVGQLTSHDEPEMPALIFDQLVAEWPTVLAARTRALRTPTLEMGTVFMEMTKELDLDWRCDSCRVGRDGEALHVSCARCSCACSIVLARS